MAEALLQTIQTDQRTPAVAAAAPSRSSSSSPGLARSLTGMVGFPFAIGAALASAIAFIAVNYAKNDGKNPKKSSSTSKSESGSSPFQDYLDYRFAAHPQADHGHYEMSEENDVHEERKRQQRRPPTVEKKFAKSEPHRPQDQAAPTPPFSSSSTVPDFSRLEGVSMEPDLPRFLANVYRMSRNSRQDFKQLVQHLTSFFRREEILSNMPGSADFKDKPAALEDSRAAKRALAAIIERNQAPGTKREFARLSSQLTNMMDHHMINIHNLTRSIARHKLG